jgi:hypothetical protein
MYPMAIQSCLKAPPTTRAAADLALAESYSQDLGGDRSIHMASEQASNTISRHYLQGMFACILYTFVHASEEQ